jgi:hypothetical protein
MTQPQKESDELTIAITKEEADKVLRSSKNFDFNNNDE